MYSNFISHDAEKSVSSSNIFQYLDKENSEEKLKNQSLIAEGKEEEINPNSVEHFFNQDFNPYDLEDKNSMIDVYEASMQIDKNRGTQSLSSSNFYMLNISPSQKELKHMEKIAIEELENRGLKYDEIKDSVEVVEFYEEQKDQLMKLQMKLFTKDVMEEYARQMDREIYANQEALPDNAERKAMQPEIDKRYNDFLKSKGIYTEDKELEKIKIDYEEELQSDLENGKLYKIKQEEQNHYIYVPNDKHTKINQNQIEIDKNYFEEKLQESKDKQNGIFTDDKIVAKIQLEQEKGQSIFISYKPNNYDSEIKLWLNNSQFSKLDNQTIEINKYKFERLISKAIERDKEQKKMVEIPFNHYTSKDIKSKEDKMLTFYKEEKGFKEPLPFTFKASELEEREGKFYVENFKLQYRMEKAKDLAIRKEYGEKKEEFKNQVWKENGFDTTKRKIEGKDLLYFAKVERNRTYSHKDKEVLRNRPILKKIEEYKNSKNPLKKMKISDLQNELLRDKYTGEVIKEGVKKGGMNYHTHIIVSRHDKTSINPKDKVSMSPNANQREGVLNNGAKVGFDRDMFFQKVENIFDTKFEYNRQETEKYVNVNQKKKSYNKALTGELKGRLIGEVEKSIGLDTVKQELNPIRKAKQEIMPIPLPSSLPKSKIDLVIKMVKVLKNAVDKGVQY
ncbi:DUF5712 family protein [Riemerella anatipestifer]|nr:DUF5712 family protein [Riemerella anatipestifer]